MKSIPNSRQASDLHHRRISPSAPQTLQASLATAETARFTTTSPHANTYVITQVALSSNRISSFPTDGFLSTKEGSVLTGISVRSQHGGKRSSSRSRSQERRGRKNSTATALGSSSAWKVELGWGKRQLPDTRTPTGPTQGLFAPHSSHWRSWPGGLGAGPHLSGEECGFLMSSM